ncbi:MAG: FAD-dependent oxidoreductase [Pseudomonadota bacterium]
MATVDVTIRGAGVFGLCIAWACLQRGARVRVIDPAGPGAGASGGVVGALAPHVPENWNPKKAFQFDSLIMARRLWPEIEEMSGLPTGYARTGRLQPIADEAALALAQDRKAGARTHWGDAAQWDVTRAADHAPWRPHSATGQYIFDTLSAHLSPRHAVEALAKAITRLGGTICDAHADEGAVVMATGATGLAEVTNRNGTPLGAPIKGQAALLAFDAGEAAPQLFADQLHIIPHFDGTVAIGSTTERVFDDAQETDEQLDALLMRVRRAIPALAEARVIRRWAGLRPRARSRAPILGALPDQPGRFIANGGFKIGFGMAPKVGEVMAHLVLEGVDVIPEGFRVEDN